MKTKAMLCNCRRKWDFIQELNIKGEHRNEVVGDINVVGFILRSDMKTFSNTSYITGKGYKRMWLLRRLKALGATKEQLIDKLQKQISQSSC